MRRALFVVAVAVLLESCSSQAPVAPLSVSCGDGESACGQSCAKLQTDDHNCGSCGVACAEGTACANGACFQKDCPGDACDPASVCFQSACTDKLCVGVICPSGESCSKGVCVCGENRLACGGGCVDPLTDESNCGACGNACAATDRCANGTCLPKNCASEQCNPLSVCFQGSCVADACVGIVCTGGQECQGGVCACAPGKTSCNGACVDGDTDNQNCGGCGNVCSSGTRCAQGACLTQTCGSQACDPLSVCYPGNCVEAACVGVACNGGRVCSAGVCTCGTGKTDCGADGCVDTSTDEAHCGTCGTSCGVGDTCASGTCVQGSCAAGKTPCGGACVDVKTDAANCNACGNVCGGGRNCVNGACACPSSLTYCGTSCVNTQTDNANCGGCNRSCNGGTCQAGVCSCPSGQSACNGACVTLSSDNNNCAVCGRACTNGMTCISGGCGCGAGSTLCGGSCIPTQSDNLNCGGCGVVCPSQKFCSGGTCQSPFTCQTNYNTAPSDCAAFPLDVNLCGVPTTSTTGAPVSGQLAASGTSTTLPVTVNANQRVRVDGTFSTTASGGANYRLAIRNSTFTELVSAIKTAPNSTSTTSSLAAPGKIFACANPTDVYLADTLSGPINYSMTVTTQDNNGKFNTGSTSLNTATALAKLTGTSRACDQVCGSLSRICGDSMAHYGFLLPAGKAAVIDFAMKTDTTSGASFTLTALQGNGAQICDLVSGTVTYLNWTFSKARLVNNTPTDQQIVLQSNLPLGGNLDSAFEMSVAVEP
ncbi:MAG: hypothetical protein ACJ790_22055 [Myxococcaceae bacterium]